MSEAAVLTTASAVTFNRGITTVAGNLREQIIEAVKQGFEEQIEFTKTLVRFESLRGGEHAIQDFVFRSYREYGLAVDRFGMDRSRIEAHPGGSKYSAQHSDAPIIVGIHRPQQEKGRSLILQAHVDVVPAGPASLWSRTAFEPKIEGDWMFGRGAADMKAGHAANLFALKALRRLGLQPAATVYLQSVVEEESTGNGALMTHLRGYRSDAVLIPEPEDEKLVRANTGVLWFEVRVEGHPVHVREMQSGANAIDAAYRVVASLRQLEASWNERKAGREHFEREAHPINLNIGRIETRPVFEYTLRAAGLKDPSAMLPVYARIAESGEKTTQFMNVLAGTVDFKQFFTPSNISRLLA